MRGISYWLGLILIFLMPWERIIHIEGLGTISRIAGVMVAASWMLCAIANGVRTLKPFHGLVFVFVVWNALSIFWTVDPVESFARIGTYMRVGVLSVIIWDLYRSADSVRMALQAFVLGGLVPALNTIANYLTGVQTDYGRYSTSGDNMNATAFILALTVPVAIYLAIEGHRLRSRWTGILSMVNFSCILVAMFAIGLTGTRFAILMTLPAWVYAVWSLVETGRARGLAAIGIMIVCLFGIVSFLPASTLERLTSMQQEFSSGDLNGRTVVWRLGLESWVEHPLIGIGAGASGEPSVEVFGFPKSVHNSFVAVLVELGLIGICLMGAILLSVLWHAKRMPHRASMFWLSLLAVWGLGNLPITCFHVKESWLFLSLLITDSYALAAASSSTGEPVGSAPENTIQIDPPRMTPETSA